VTSRFARASLVLLVLCSAPSAWAGEWKLQENGECVEVADRGDYLRGPTVLLNGVLYPLRSLEGGLFFSLVQCLPSRCWPLAPLWLGASIVGGIAGGVKRLATGTADSFTGGRLLVSPFDDVEITLRPVVPFLPGPTVEDEDRCPGTVQLNTSAPLPPPAPDPRKPGP
jgi:hypothetical protein